MSDDATVYDVLVIGSGPGGYVAFERRYRYHFGYSYYYPGAVYSPIIRIA